MSLSRAKPITHTTRRQRESASESVRRRRFLMGSVGETQHLAVSVGLPPSVEPERRKKNGKKRDDT